MARDRDPYTYPGTDVLINKEGIRDDDQLNDFERRMVAQRMAEDLPDVPLTAEGYRQLHHHLFQDVYEWAGQDRTVDMSKNHDAFCRSQFIDGQLTKRFEAIQNDAGLQRGASVDRFAGCAAQHLTEINAIHPFREGNGRTQRLFREVLVLDAGFDIDIARIQPEQWNQASRNSFRTGDAAQMQAVIADAIVGRDPAVPSI